MRIGWVLLSMLLCAGLLGCNNDDVATEPLSAREELTTEKEDWSREFLKRLDDQLAVKEYAFTLTLQDGTSFHGSEMDGEWSLTSEDKAIQIKQEDGTIHLTHEEQTETLSTRQFGLVSPRDHMKLVQESVQRVNKETKNNQDWYVVDLNKEEMGNQLGQWMGKAYDEGPASQASRKFTFRYRFQFDPSGLRQMTMKIIPIEEGDASEMIRYTFETQ